jgi:hypothetical protein
MENKIQQRLRIFFFCETKDIGKLIFGFFITFSANYYFTNGPILADLYSKYHGASMCGGGRKDY